MIIAEPPMQLVVETADELKTFPRHTVFIDDEGTVGEKIGQKCFLMGYDFMVDPDHFAYPVTVLYVPEKDNA